MANILMVVAPDGFRDEELFIPQEIFVKSGHDVTIASTKAGRCMGSRGGSAQAELAIKDVDLEIYQAVVFVGGGGSRVFFSDPDARRIATDMHQADKLVAAICIAPVILANAGLLRNKKATVFSEEAETIRNKGANYTRQGVTADGNIVTGDSPQSAKLFAEKICELLK